MPASARLDYDGHLDVVIGTSASPMWFRNMANAGDGSNSVSFPASPVAIGYVATQDLFNVVTVGFGDIDGDGVVDVLSSTPSTLYGISWFKNRVAAATVISGTRIGSVYPTIGDAVADLSTAPGAAVVVTVYALPTAPAVLPPHGVFRRLKRHVVIRGSSRDVPAFLTCAGWPLTLAGVHFCGGSDTSTTSLTIVDAVITGCGYGVVEAVGGVVILTRVTFADMPGAWYSLVLTNLLDGPALRLRLCVRHLATAPFATDCSCPCPLNRRTKHRAVRSRQHVARCSHCVCGFRVPLSCVCCAVLC